MARIETSTIKFLKDITVNNNRDWFAENKGRYQEAHQNVKDFVLDIDKHFEKHDDIEASKIFRIYRDVRFSKNKVPYKNSFGISFKRATKALRGGYYLHIEPGNSMIGGGFWNPNPADLLRIRKELEMDAAPLRKIIKSKAFTSTFGTLNGDAVKTSPKGFSKAHADIDLIRMKQFLVHIPLTDKEVKGEDFAKTVSDTFKKMRPFFNYMSMVLTTDINGTPLD